MRLPVDVPTADASSTAELESLLLEKFPEDAVSMTNFGQRLYRILNGPSGHLASLVPNSTLELRFDAQPGKPAALAHLPWELLHDGASFLVQRGIIPVRQISFVSQSEPDPPAALANRPLNVLFMACSPRNVQPVLNFENEERIILSATEGQPLYFVPEETGSVEGLFETARSYDPFDVFHLTGHGDLYDESRHKACLTEDQHFTPGRPILLTENDRGFCLLQDAEDIERAFENRIPKLVFLSGCRTSELPGQPLPEEARSNKDNAHSSLAQDLLYRGFPSVMGWARPVFDQSATFAAALLYQEISAGSTVEGALRYAFRELTLPGPNNQPFQIPDWHLLRLFTTQLHSSAALVTVKTTPNRVEHKPVRPDEGFLDKEKKLKVAGFKRFVGRRRSLQRTLPALAAESEHTGVIVWGMGGLGKSSLAARLCDRVERRRSQFRRVVVDGKLNEKTLLAALRAKYRFHTALKTLNDESLELGGKLFNFFKQINSSDPILLALDDFEQNITLDPDAKDAFRLSPEAFNVLEALGSAIHEAGAQSRLIVTTRYWSETAFPDVHLLPEQLPQMDSSELRKKARTELPEAGPQQAEQLIASAAGNPRLFEDLAGDPSAETQSKFRESLKLSEVLQTLTPDERTRLARLSVFQLPVSPSIAEEVTGDSKFHRAVSLGLAELTEPSSEDGEPELFIATLVRPLLEPVLDEDEWRAAHSSAARAVHKAWWEGSPRVPESRALEIIRLATLGGEREIACDLASRVCGAWSRVSRHRDIIQLATSVLAHFEDAHLLTRLGEAEGHFGNTESAERHLQQATALAGDTNPPGQGIGPI